MTAKAKTHEDLVGREFVITREFAAPRELVFQAWTDPKHLAQWWGPRGFTNPVCEWDVRPGGRIYDVMRAPNGTDYPMGGEFREITPPEKLVFTSGALDGKGALLFEFLHTVTFAGRADKTTLTIISRVLKTTPGADKYIGGFEAGMTQSLEKLADHCAETGGRTIIISRDFDAPRELVWEAWTNPKHVVNWWGPRGFSTTIGVMDVRPGGVWQQTMRGPDGAEYPSKSVFVEVVKPERIVFKHGGGRAGGPGVSFQMTWTFDALEPRKTRVTIRQVYATAADRDFVAKEFGAIEGGKQTLERLSEYLAGMN